MADPSRQLYVATEAEKSEARQIVNRKETTVTDRKFVSERTVQTSTTTSTSSSCPRSIVKFKTLGSPLPEDLTVRGYPTEVKPTTMEAPKKEEEEEDRPETGRNHRCHCLRRRHGNDDDDDVAWIVNVPPQQQQQQQQNPVGSSVLELEQAMNRHLPTAGDDGQRGADDDFRAATSKSGRTIRWLGSASDYCSRLPASTLLRTLYANRESVIRTNVSSSSSRVHCYPDSSQPPLLTPPYTTGTSPYIEPPFTCKTPPVDGYGQSVSGGHVSSFPPPPPPASLNMLSSGMMTSSDVYVTPPSSVSPHGKYPADGVTGQRYDVTASMMTLRATAYVSSSPYVDYQQHGAMVDAAPLGSCYNFNANAHNNVSGFSG